MDELQIQVPALSPDELQAELTRRMAEQEAINKISQEESAKSIQDRAYINRDIGKEAENYYRNEVMGGRGAKGVIKRILLGALEGAAMGNTSKKPEDRYKGIEAEKYKQLMEEYKVQAPLRQRDLSSYETNQAKREIKEAEMKNKALQNERAFDLKIKELAQKNNVDEAKIRSWAIKNKNIEAATKLLGTKDLQSLLEYEYSKAHPGEKMAPTSSTLQLGRAAMSGDPGGILSILMKNKGESSTTTERSSNSIKHIRDPLTGKVIAVNSPSSSVSRVTRGGGGNIGLDFLKNNVDILKGRESDGVFMPQSLPNKEGTIPPARPSRSLTPPAKTPVSANVETDQFGNRVVAQVGIPPTAAEKSDLRMAQKLHGMTTLATDSILKMGPEELRKFIGPFGKSTEFMIKYRKFMGLRGMSEDDFNRLNSRGAWITALENSGKALSPREITLLGDIVPSGADISPEQVIKKAVAQQLVVSLNAQRLSLLAEGKINKEDINQMNMAADINRLADAATKMVMAGQKIDIEDLNGALIHPEVIPGAKGKNKYYYQMKKQDMLNKLKMMEEGVQKKKAPASGGWLDVLKGAMTR